MCKKMLKNVRLFIVFAKLRLIPRARNYLTNFNMRKLNLTLQMFEFIYTFALLSNNAAQSFNLFLMSYINWKSYTKYRIVRNDGSSADFIVELGISPVALFDDGTRIPLTQLGAYSQIIELEDLFDKI